jgi:hypothetical protein
MSSHDDLLLGSQSARLAQNRPEYLVNFADVMKECRGDNPFDFLFSQADGGRNYASFFGNSSRMTRCVWVTGLNCCDH